MQHIYSDPEFRAICRKTAGQLAEDLFQELALALLELPEDKFRQVVEGCLKCFWYRMADYSFNRPRSRFFKHWRKEERALRRHHDNIVQAWESGPDEELIAKMLRAIEEGYWYDQGVLFEYIEKGTLKEVSKATSIPVVSLHNTIKGFKAIIRKKVKKYE